MNPHVIAAFGREMTKVAYGDGEHAQLAQNMSKGLGQGKSTALPVQNAVRKGALQVDQGIRHPFLPHTDPLHSFPGSQSRATVGRNMVAKQQSAVGDIAKSIAGRQGGFVDRTLSGARAYRGLKNLGEANHQLMDIGAHYNKPLEQGFSTSLRSVVPQTGYGGGIVSGREHARSGLNSWSEARVDELHPTSSAVDRSSINRSTRMGTVVPKQVSSQLQSAHGMTPQQAEAATQHFFTQVKQPNILSRAAGEASRDARYLRGEVSRAGTALRQGAQGLRTALPAAASNVASGAGSVGRFFRRAGADVLRRL
jgi:hypothetical protein